MFRMFYGRTAFLRGAAWRLWPGAGAWWPGRWLRAAGGLEVPEGLESSCWCDSFYSEISDLYPAGKR